MITYKEAVNFYSKNLKHVTNIPRKEVEILLLFVIKKDLVWLHIHYDDICHCENNLKKLVQLRQKHYPIEYITKTVNFYGESFNICNGVLIPRSETELLIDHAIGILKNLNNPNVIEIGTGSGVISIILALFIEKINIIAVDINELALELANINAEKFKVQHKINFIKSDLFDNLNEKKIDMCISNPPYIKNNFIIDKNLHYEPKNALFGGNRGDEILMKLIKQSPKKKIKYLLCEMGYDQKESIKNFVSKINTKNLKFYKDYSNNNRGFIIEF